MDREFLKSLELSDDAIEQVMKKHGQAITSTKQELDTLVEENNSLKEQLETRDNDIAELKEKAKDSEELTAKLDEMAQSYETEKANLTAKLEDTNRKHTLELALREAGAKNTKAVSALIDMESLTFEEGKLVGLDDQLATIQKENDYLFNQAQEQAKPSIVPSGNPNGNEGKQQDDVFAAKIAQITGEA